MSRASVRHAKEYQYRDNGHHGRAARRGYPYQPSAMPAPHSIDHVERGLGAVDVCVHGIPEPLLKITHDAHPV
jgi:hypothetical protein